jgi:hypothetical protein
LGEELMRLIGSRGFLADFRWERRRRRRNRCHRAPLTSAERKGKRTAQRNARRLNRGRC